jgi:WD40 repeat protein
MLLNQTAVGLSIGTLSADKRYCALTIRRITRPPLYRWRIRVYDLSNGNLTFEREVGSSVTALALSSNGGRLAYSLADSSEIVLEDLVARQTLWKRVGLSEFVDAFAFSPDDRLVAVGSRVSPISILDAADGKTRKVLSGQDGRIVQLSWEPIKNRIISADSNGNVDVWDPNRITPPFLFEGFFNVAASTQPLCVSNDGSSFVAPVRKNALAWRSVSPTENPVPEVPGQIPLGFDADSMGYIALTESGSFVHYRTRQDGSVYALQSRQLLPVGSGVEDAAISSDQGDLAVACRDGTARFFDLRRDTCSTFSGPDPGDIGWISVSPNGELSVAGGVDQTVRVFKRPNATPIWSHHYIAVPYFAAISPDGGLVAIGLKTGDLEIRHTGDGSLIKQIRTDYSDLESIAFHPDGSRLFVGGANGSVQVFETHDWGSVVTLSMSEGARIGDRTISRLAMSADGGTLMAFRADGCLARWRSRDP